MGMHYYERIPSQVSSAADPHSGLPCSRLTAAVGHSHCLYFTSDGWTADQQYLIIAGERAATGNQLYAVELASGDAVRITDCRPGAVPDHHFNYASLSPDGSRIAYWNGKDLTILTLESGREEVIYQAQGEVHGTSWTADGRAVLTCRSQHSSVGNGSSTADRLRWLEQPPLSQVISVASDGSATHVLHEAQWLITHVNASPIDPDLCTFCHEGPWLEIDQRIWGLRLSGGSPWPVVPRDPDWGVGHEYWCADGVTVGYHARHRDGTWRHAAGFCHVLSGDVWQAELAVPTHHAVAISPNRVFLDGTRSSGEWLLAVDRQGDEWAQPRVLCRHDSSRHHHRAHVHARPRADGRVLAFNSDRRGYTDVYLIDVPSDISALPEWPGTPYRYYWE
ncbi:MAG: hypothetical protein EA401_04680 [Planctomycetota bacterium]|nr:MAG: hypothetical protein EA401_04680 [Planctomycetota bacterium]